MEIMLMPTLKLTARFVDGVKPGTSRIEYFDTVQKGLVLRVTEQGAKSWCVMYRHRGRLRRLTLGSTDALVLAQARERAHDELYAASKGEDVAQAKQDEKKAETIHALANDYIEKYALPRKRSWKADRQRLDRHVLPKWKHRAVADITRADIRQLAARVAKESGPIEANRLVSLLSKLFAYAVDQDIIKASPAVKIPKPGQEQSRDRVLNDAEIRTLWNAWETLDAPMGDYFKLQLLTAQRGQEVRDMRWQDVDLESGWWTVPATSAKNKLSHRVYLGPAAGAIIAKRLATADTDETFVLTGARGRRQQYTAVATFPVEDMVPHDLRRTAASIMASGGVSRFVIGRVLNHVEKSVTATYDRHSYDPEKQAALAWLDAKLTAILENRGSHVLAFHRSA
jgi:integrase